MLNSLKAFARTTIGKILGVFLLIAVAGFGITGVITTIGTQTVARVGSEDISTRDFQRSYSQQINAIAQQSGRAVTIDQALAMGIPSAIISQLATEAALNELGREFGLGVSNDRLGDMVREDPAFGGTLGSFERQNFLRVLQVSGYTEAEYFERQRNTARRQQLVLGLFGNVEVPRTALDIVHRYAGDRRTVDYFTLGELALPEIEEPTEAELQAYLDDNQQQFRTVETRDIRVMVLSPATLAAGYGFTDEEIAAEYERIAPSLTEPERRTIVQVPLATGELVAAFEAGIEAGTPFEELVEVHGLTPASLGTLAEDRIADRNLAAAAFALEPGGYAIVPGITGQRAISVTAIEGGTTVPLEEAEAEVVASLGAARARTEFIERLDDIEELRAAFVPLDQIADTVGLEPVEVTASASGAEIAAATGLPQEVAQRVANAAFVAQPGQLSPSVTVGAELSVWFDLIEINEARDRTLEEVGEEVRDLLVAQRTAAALAAEAEAILSELEAGADFADLAIARGHFPELSQPFGRQGDPTGAVNGPAAVAAFEGGIGHAGAAENAAGALVVFQVVAMHPAEGEIGGGTRDFVANTYRDNVYSEFVTGIRDTAGVRINQQALNSVLELYAEGQ